MEQTAAELTFEQVVANATEAAKAELVKVSVTDQALAELNKQYAGLTIMGTGDKDGYKAVQQGLSHVKKIRTSVEARRKELKAPALEFGRAIDSEAKRITEALTPLEAHLRNQKDTIDEAIEAERRAVELSRIQALQENGYNVIGSFFVLGPFSIPTDGIAAMDEEQFNIHLERGKQELIRQQAEAQAKAEREAFERAERDRIAAEAAQRAQAEADARKAAEAAARKAEAENEALRKQLAAMQAPQQPAPAPASVQQQAPQVAPPAVKPIPTPAPVQPVQPVAARTSDYDAGFRDCLEQVVEAFTMPVQRTRAQWLEVFSSLKPRQ
jgi:colicin import membrane protein